MWRIARLPFVCGNLAGAKSGRWSSERIPPAFEFGGSREPVQWININVATIDSEEFLGAGPVERGTWLCLMRYCVGQENGGTILKCGEWSDRKWQQVCGVTREEVRLPCKLWSWWGEGSLNVAFYPIETEQWCQRKRTIGRRSVQKRWANRAENGEHPPKPRKKR